MERLKPCPFCGGKPYLFSEDRPSESGGVTRGVVRCTVCAARVEYVMDGILQFQTAERKAAEAWNRRESDA